VKQVIALILNEFMLNRERRERFTVDTSNYKLSRGRAPLPTDNDPEAEHVK
jgi:hypothetical protein